MTKIATLISGGEVDEGCVKCGMRYFDGKNRLYQPCERCGETIIEYDPNDEWYFDRELKRFVRCSDGE